MKQFCNLRDVATFNEFNCHVKGITFLVENFCDDDFCDPEADYQVDAASADLSRLSLNDELSEARRQTFRFTEERKIVSSFAVDDKGRFPFLMVMAGSGNGNFIVSPHSYPVMKTDQVSW